MYTIFHSLKLLQLHLLDLLAPIICKMNSVILLLQMSANVSRDWCWKPYNLHSLRKKSKNKMLISQFGLKLQSRALPSLRYTEIQQEYFLPYSLWDHSQGIVLHYLRFDYSKGTVPWAPNKIVFDVKQCIRTYNF